MFSIGGESLFGAAFANQCSEVVREHHMAVKG